MIRKLLSSVVLSAFLFVSVIFPLANNAKVLAQEDVWYQQDYFNWYERVYNPDNEDEIFGERYTAAQVEWIIYSIFTFMWNHIGDREVNHCAIEVLNDTDNFIDVIAFRARFISIGENGCGDEIIAWFTRFINVFNVLSSSQPSPEPIAGLPQWTATFTSSELSTYGYISKAVSGFNLIPEVKAQGFGYASISGMIGNIWRASRDISYFFLVLATIVMAFMIMFRTKISPQTVITVQSALPKIVVALVLITFSFAIGGFMIDLMYVVLGLLSALLTSTTANISNFTWSNMFEAFTQRTIFSMMFFYWIEWILAALVASFSFWGWIAGNILAAFFIIVIWLILIIVLLIATFKTMWMLVKTYISIIFQIAFSPFLIVGGVLGMGGGFTGWIRNLAASLAVYPTVAILFFVAFLLLAPAFPDFGALNDLLSNIRVFDIPADALGESTGFWIPPFNFGAQGFELMMVFASLSVIMMIPKAAELVKSAIAGKPFGYGSAIGEGLAPFTAVAAATGGAVGGYVGDQSAAIGTAIGNRYPGLKGPNWERVVDRISNRVRRGGPPNVPRRS